MGTDRRSSHLHCIFSININIRTQHTAGGKDREEQQEKKDKIIMIHYSLRKTGESGWGGGGGEWRD
jgi:hypothetical protein